MLSVLTPAKSARLVTLDDARLDLNLSVEAVSNARLARLIDQASGRVAGYCNRVFGRQIYRQQILCFPEDGLLFSAGPVNRIVSLSIQGGAVLGTDDYVLSDGRLMLTHGPGIASGNGAAYSLWTGLRPTMVVDYEAGWLLPGEDVGDVFGDAEPLPSEIEAAVIQLVAVGISEGTRDRTVKSETVEGIGSTSYYVQGAGAGLPSPAAEAALQPYRQLVLV